VKIEFIRIEGEAYVTLETVAACYACETEWVVEVYRCGLLGEGHRHRDSVAVPVHLLDRSASIWRLHRRSGLSLESIEAILTIDD
jgi:hypothetical protein